VFTDFQYMIADTHTHTDGRTHGQTENRMPSSANRRWRHKNKGMRARPSQHRPLSQFRQLQIIRRHHTINSM